MLAALLPALGYRRLRRSPL
ncbi:MAG: hypothetical protein ACK47B_16145 [Armatimonadota bacterium]